VGIETEVKVVLVDVGEFQRRLDRLNRAVSSARHFEDNYLLDFPDGRMRSEMRLVRVRLTDARCFLTFKERPLASEVFKSREELETTVADGTTVLRILEHLGLRVWFRYQKYRQEFIVPSAQRHAETVHIAVDRTPIGDFAEFEGSEEGIRDVAGMLGFEEAQFLKDSYYSLYVRYCRDRGERVTNMTFPPEPSD
jgi:adenylate cyclase, class 2